MERLSPLDAGFIDAEDQDRHLSMAIASVRRYGWTTRTSTSASTSASSSER